ncbi:UNVERIFIED_CONTAM: hypothetical protein FKN15_013090 [Acipenser sinensis]
MATFFGEVVSAYSRAVEEGDDDSEEEENEEDREIRNEIQKKSLGLRHGNRNAVQEQKNRAAAREGPSGHRGSALHPTALAAGCKNACFKKP